MNEIWKPVKGFEQHYAVSNIGRMKRIKSGAGTHVGRILKTSIHRQGYILTDMSINGKSKKYSLHRLIANTFIPNPENKREVNHINGIKGNNNIDNLEWVTSSENVIHSFKNGLQIPLRGKEHPMSKLTNEDVYNIRELLKTQTTTKVGKLYNMCRNSMLNIKTGYTWSHI